MTSNFTPISRRTRSNAKIINNPIVEIDRNDNIESFLASINAQKYTQKLRENEIDLDVLV